MNLIVSQEDGMLIAQIVQRADPQGLSAHEHLHNDLAACHNAHGLNLQQLLDADDATFQQEIDDIKNHIDRETGQLHDHQPKFSNG